MKIKISFSAILTLAALLLFGRISDVICVLSAAAIHETGHIVAAKLLGVSFSSLCLDPLGARLNTTEQLVSYKREALLALGGPLANIISLAFSAPLAVLTGSEFLIVFSYASAGLALLNLLPIETFDGGRIFYCITRSYRFSRIVSFLCLFAIFCASLYLLLRTGGALSVFIFSTSLFVRLFVVQK